MLIIKLFISLWKKCVNLWQRDIRLVKSNNSFDLCKLKHEEQVISEHKRTCSGALQCQAWTDILRAVRMWLNHPTCMFIPGINFVCLITFWHSVQFYRAELSQMKVFWRNMASSCYVGLRCESRQKKTTTNK